MTEEFSDNQKQNRFEYKTEGGTAFANYRKQNGTLFIDYVESPPQLRGTGAAGKLMQHVMDTARAENIKVIPICGYAAMWITRHNRS